MTRTEKNKLKKKYKRNFILGVITFIITIFLLLLPVMFDIESKFDNNFSFVIILLFLIIIFVGLFLSFFHKSNKYEFKLYERKIKLQKERNRLHVEQFWNKITEGKYDQAKEIFEHETLIPYNTDLRFLCLGILLGMIQQNGKLATKWDVNPMEKMNKIFACY